jgi:SAM-dependent methyltransferase
MTDKSYDKYSGTFNVNIYTDPVKACHQKIKNFIIGEYASNIEKLIDIGSGRGHDYDAWKDANIKKVIGLEPSEKSISSAIRKYSKQKNKIKITYIRAVGNELWQTGKAALDEKSKKSIIETFKNRFDADNIHLFWTIHYCLNTKKDFLNLYKNINSNLKTNGKLIILSMNGFKINKLLKKYNGSYKVKTDDGQTIFEINGYYNYNVEKIPKYGNTIGIKLAGTYGLDQEIKENLVKSKFLINFFKKHNYKLLLKDNFINFAKNNNIDCINSYNKIQKKISILYNIIIFEKNN